MPIEPYKRLTNEIDSFLSSNGLHHPLSILTLSEVETSPCDLVLKICSALAGVRLRLSLLDRLIRRSSALDLGPDDYLIIMGHLVKELRSLEHCLPDESQTFHDVCLCLQLMSHCLSKASCGDKLCRSLEELFESFVFVSNISSVDCLTAGFTLLVQILRLQWGDQLLDVVLSLITLPPVASACLPTSAYFTFTERLFLDDKQRTPQLAFLLALIGQLQDHIRPSTGYLSETVLRQILSFAFSIVGDDSKSSYSALESTPLILLSKIGQSWSACCRSLSVHSSYNFLQSLCSSAGLLDTPVWTLLEFCLEMKGSLFSVVRHSCLDTIDNLMQTHFILCEDCNSICLCEAVMSLFRQVTSATWLSRGTLSVILRIVTALFQCTPCSVSNLLPFLLWDSHAKEQDTAHQLACVASSLLYCAMDPSLSMHVSELYALIGSKLLTEKEELLCIWLSTLITLAINDYSTFGSAIIQYILPSLFSSNCALVYRLIELSKTDGSTYSVPLLLTCYRLLNYPKRKVTKKDDADDTLSIIPLLQTALVCSDLQIRLDALNFLRASIQRTKISTELLQLIDVVFYCLRFNQWSLERPLRQQLCYTIFVAAARMRELKMQFVSSPSCFLDILIRMAALLLQGIYPGVPAPRLSFCLNGLYGLVMALCPSAEGGDKGILDSDSNWTIHRILNQAAWWAYDIRISQTNTDSLALSEQLCPFDPYLLVSHLFVGLSSTFEDDREFALQLCLLLRISHYIPPSTMDELRSQALTTLTTSAKPDVNPLSWQLVRFVINADLSPTPLMNGVTGYPGSFDSLPPTTQRAIVTVSYLLDLIEQQVNSVEAPDGLLTVAATKPFYAMLSTVRAILDPGGPSLSHMICRTAENDQQQAKTGSFSDKYYVKRLGGVNLIDVCFRKFYASDGSTTCIANRLIALALRISGCILPVLAHASPEGFLPDDEAPNLTEVDSSAQSSDPSGISEARKYPEYVTICCWRSVRELSLLLGVSLSPGLQFTPNPSCSDSPMYKLSELQVLEIGEFFCSQLLCGRHCGAVEQCSLGFYPFCQALLRTHLRHWPLWWLQSVLDDLLEVPSPFMNHESPTDLAERARFLPLVCLHKTDEGYCVTRRSAGLPLFIKDILSANCAGESTRDSLTVSTLDRLLSFADNTLKALCSCDAPAAHSVQRCVVSLNIARTLFRSAGLTQSTSSIVERAICLSLDGLGLSDWAIRNSSSLLFSTLTERILGVSRSSGIVNPKRSLSAANLFTRYPSLKCHVLRVLQEGTGNSVSPSAHETRLYAVLVLLSRLLPPIQLPSASGSTESILYPYVIRCLANRNIRIRQMAARSMGCLIHSRRLSAVTAGCINHLQRLAPVPLREQKRSAHSNLIHGLLLLLQQLFASDCWLSEPEDTRGESPSGRIHLLCVLTKTLSHLADLSLTPCPLVRKAFLSIPNPTLSLDLNHLCLHGLHLEASIVYLQQLVRATVASFREPIGQRNTFDLTLVDILQQLRSTECHMLALREAVHTAVPDTIGSVDMSVEPFVAIAEHGSLDTHFLDRLAQWIDPTGLFNFSKAISISDEACALIVRYSFLLMAIVSPVWPTESAPFTSLVAWAHPLISALRPRDYLAAIYLPAVVQLLSAMAAQSKRLDANMTQLTEEIIYLMRLCVRFSHTLMDDACDLQRSLLYAIASLFSSFRLSRLTCADSDELVQFLIFSLLNLHKPDLQWHASRCCRSIANGHFGRETDVPLPFASYTEFVSHLLQSGWYTGPKLMNLLAEMFLPNSSGPADELADECGIRVFAHEDPYSLKDLLASLNTVAWTASISKSGCPRAREVDNIAENIRANLSTQLLQAAQSGDLFTWHSDVCRKFAVNCITAYQREISDPTEPL